jgi:ubiquinone/menaquinone biosynthesis C-methylase UbiE
MGLTKRESELRKLYSRQANAIRPARNWLIETKLNTSFFSVLEVGCGYGDVLHEFGKDKFSVGLDINLQHFFLTDFKMEGVLGDAHFLPFPDSSFDMVYCHIALMWFSEPVCALKEMARVSKKWICCLAEFDYGARVDFPDEFKIISDKLAERIIADGGDPYVGRKLHRYFSEAGLEAEVGAYCHVMNHEQLERGFEWEWDFIEEFTDMDEAELDRLKKNELESIKAKSRFLFTPVFYAIAQKK